MRRLFIFLLFILIPAAGVVLLGRYLDAIYQEPAAATAEPIRFPPALAGAPFHVLADPGFHRIALNSGTLLVEGPHRILGQARVALCDQTRDRNDPASPLIPLSIGVDWSQIRQRIDANLASAPPRPASAGLKNPMLDDGPGGVDVPDVVLDTEPPGAALAAATIPDRQLRLTLRDRRTVTGVSDAAPDLSHGAASTLSFYQNAWLLWDAGSAPGQWRQALQIHRLLKDSCRLGAIQVTVYGPPDETVPAQATRRLRFYPRQGPTRTFQLAPGDYAVPPERTHAPEDADLFAAATATGLIRVDRTRYQVTVAPADLSRRLRFAHDHPERLVAEPGGESWSTLDWTEAAQATHRLLYHSPAGNYLRQQLAIFNSRRLLAAVRLRAEDPDHPPGAGPWQADWRNIRLPLTDAMPLLAGGLFAEVPRHWDPWQRIEHWPDGVDAATPVRFTLPLAGRPTPQRLQLLVTGRAIRIEGARILGSEPRCLTASPCRDAAALAYALWLQLPPNATRLTVQFQPLPAPAAPALFRRDFAHIRLADDGQLSWRVEPPVARRQRDDQQAQVTLRDRQDMLLWDSAGPTEAAWTLGLSGLVGLDPSHQTAVAGVLARLRERGADSVAARLTLDHRLQELARAALHQQLSAAAAQFGVNDPYRTQRFASLVVLDANQGDILAAVSLPEPPRDAAWLDLYRFDAAHRRGPLYWWAWQHDGGALHRPGSTFKLISALTLERSAQERPELEALLEGLEPGAITRHPLAGRYDFGVEVPCYPAHQQPCVHNFRHGGGYATLKVSSGEPRYGLEQALRDSLNTWFAWLVETTDATLLDNPQAAGLPSVRALTAAALDRVRPLAAVTAALGFGAAARLDGGLLPAEVLRTGDLLLTTPSRLDVIESRHDVRLAALGFRMQVTPLQMAQVVASIATNQRVIPRLLLELNGRPAAKPAFAPLGIPAERIRQGMKRVPKDGTAQEAFADGKNRNFATLRPYLYAKTGTADLSEQYRGLNNAWLVGWVEPRGIPGEDRRLAFACVISHTQGTGGKQCGTVVANFLAALADATQREKRSVGE